MSTITISETKDYFVRDGKGFFYFADTIWSAFSNMTIEEWEVYLDHRRAQGFNTLQISILPIIHDTTQSDLNLLPFHTKADGTWDYESINEAFFNRAVEMLKMADERGFIPALVVLWSNYVPDNRFADLTKGVYVMPNQAIRHYTEYVVHAFGPFNPFYIISGDTNFGSAKTVSGYMTALETIKELSPESLTTFHLQPSSDLHEEFVQSPLTNFYTYQSGHHYQNQNNSYLLAKRFYEKPVKRPVVNAEPCYEGHGHGHTYGRFHAFDVRKATWQSLLSGAKAGVTYGAHGVWSWHKKGSHFNNEKFSSIPYEWRTALQLEGAWDVGYAKWIFEQYDLFDIQPIYDGILNDTPEIRLSASPDHAKVAIYAPYQVNVKVALDLTNHRMIGIDLKERRVFIPEVESSADLSVIKMSMLNADVLYIGVKHA